MFRERPRLTDDQRVHLAKACLENALHLVLSGEALVPRGELPSALFRVGSAREEVLKARDCIEEGAPSWDAWWRGYRDHRTKLDVARRYWPELNEESTRALRDLRERCLYVEVKATGTRSFPAARLTQASWRPSSSSIGPFGYGAKVAPHLSVWCRRCRSRFR